MKKVLFLVTITLLLAVTGFGQKDTPRVGETTGDGNAVAQTSGQSSNGGTNISAGTMLQGELQSNVDVNRSKVGDRVVVKTTKAVKQAGKTIVPKGTQLVGRVTEIAKRSKENAQSRIGVLFDRIEGTNLSQPISLTIVSITRAGANASFDDDQGAFSTEGINTTTVNSADPARSGSRGGLIRSTTGTATGLVSTVANTTTAAAGSAVNTVGSATQTVGSTARGAGNVVRNIDLNANAYGSASSSTTLSSNDKNFKLEKGATVNMRVDK